MNLDFKLASFIEFFCALWKFALLIFVYIFCLRVFLQHWLQFIDGACCESLLRERLVVGWLLSSCESFSSCESLSSVVCALMLDELGCLLFLCIIFEQA